MFIELSNISKQYLLGKTTINALHKLTLTIEKSSFMAISGPSGSGKPTLLNLLGCLDKPSSGEILLDKQSITQLSSKKATLLRRNTIGFVFQSFNLMPVLTAFENVELPLLLTALSKQERARKVYSLLEKVGLSDYLKHKPDELSGGQRQRVSIARALVHEPKLVLADEPTANLDQQTGETIMDLLQKMNTDLGTTFIFATHDPMVMAKAKTNVVLVDGCIKTPPSAS